MSEIETIARVLAVDTDAMTTMRDVDHLHFWIVMIGWDPRRAVLVPARPFLEAASPAARSYIRHDPSMAIGRRFMVTMVGWPTGSDDVRFLGVRVAPPLLPVLQQKAREGRWTN